MHISRKTFISRTAREFYRCLSYILSLILKRVYENKLCENTNNKRGLLKTKGFVANFLQ